MKIVEELLAQGHPSILADHATTFEITKEPSLTRRGDCVIGVNASKSPRDLSSEFRSLCRHAESKIMVELEAGEIAESIEGWGAAKLTLNHPGDMVGRKSSFVSDRTIMIGADRAARDLDRDLIEALTSSDTKLLVRITVEL